MRICCIFILVDVCALNPLLSFLLAREEHAIAIKVSSTYLKPASLVWLTPFFLLQYPAHINGPC